MDDNTGGLSSSERQRMTAAEIARKKVLAAYSGAKGDGGVSAGAGANANANANANTTADAAQAAGVAIPTTGVGGGTYKNTPVRTEVSQEEWQKYHSAWQKYYQKYYSEYYAKAARQYVEKEKLRVARQQADLQVAAAQADLSKQGSGQPNAAADAAAAQGEAEQSVLTDLRQRIRAKASEQAQKSRRNSRRRRMLTPIIAGAAVVLLILFLQYNRMIFAPIMAYVSPGNSTDTGITAVDPTVSIAVSSEPKLIIPKLNVDVPINFGISNDEDTVMEAMNHGVAQFAVPGASAMPGEIGNLAISGHSAGDIYSDNQYKFIFSGLERLVPGDLIYIDYESVRYTYSVVGMETVEPTDVAALVYDTDKPMLTLITCTPLGTSRYRLLVSAEQINPNPSGAIQSELAPSADPIAITGTTMPENEPSFFERIWNWLTGN